VTTEHRRAPRRAVEEIRRVGPWGDVKYHHHLDCGHVEVRIRATRAPVLACVSCLRAAEKDIELKALTTLAPVNYDFDEQFVRAEVEVAKIKADLAKVLKVSAEAVDVVVLDSGGTLRVQSAIVFLSAADVRRLVEGNQG
jgi:hypothetical protein